jgi:enoyl-CoA hydratase/carnithine racemase
MRRPNAHIRGDIMSDLVEIEDDGAVRTIRMNRPDKKNALTQPMYAVMTRAIHQANADDAIRCLIIAGGPGAFCAGADIGEFLESAQSGGLRPQTLEFLKTLAHNQKPLVAAVGGLAVGIGTTMLFHCDHVVAAAEATFTTPFLKLALIPEAASSLLAPMRMGYARAFEMLVMGHTLSAEQAREAGIVNKVVEEGFVDATAHKAAQEIAALPAGAVALSRRLMRGQLDAVVRQIDTEVAHFKDRLQSDEARAAFSAFLSRKK